MAKSCAICGKGRTFGNKVSHAKNHSEEVGNPISSVKAKVNGGAKENQCLLVA